MRRFLALFIALTGLAVSAQGAAAPATEAPRFAFFSMQYLVESSVKARAIWSEFEVTKKQLQEKFQAKQLEGQKLQQLAQSGSVGEEGKVQLQKQARDWEFEMKKLQEDSEAEFQRVQQKVMKALNEVAGPVVMAVAKEQKLQAVFSYENSPMVWTEEAWAKAFTAEVAKRLDASSPAPAAAPATKGVAPAVKPAARPAAAAPAPKKG